MLKFGNTSEVSVGLDIGTYSIKVVSIKEENGEKVLSAYNFKKISPGTKSSDIGFLVKEALDEIDIHPDMVNLSVSGPEVIMRFVNFPQMTKEQLQSALVFEAEKYIPFNVNEVVLDFAILGKAQEPGQMRVILAAAKKELVRDLVEKIQKLGMHVNVLDVNPLAVFNAYIQFNDLADDKATAFLELGHSQTDILISIGKDPFFMREVQIGGKDITNSISRVFSISEEKADHQKIDSKEEDAEAVKKATQSVLDDLSKEIQLSFGYFENRYNKSVGQLYCSGGMVYQEGVTEYLGMKLGIEAKRWNPIEGIRLSEMLSRQDIDSIAAQLTVSLGLALRQ